MGIYIRTLLVAYPFYFLNNSAAEGADRPALGLNQRVIVIAGYHFFDTGMLDYGFIRIFLMPYGPGYVQHNVPPELAIKLLYGQRNTKDRGKLIGPGICGHPIRWQKHGNIYG
jgi:hypothetical protein